ncbi:hypothetical protein [Streptomyces sp. NPDC046805]
MTDTLHSQQAPPPGTAEPTSIVGRGAETRRIRVRAAGPNGMTP